MNGRHRRRDMPMATGLKVFFSVVGTLGLAWMVILVGVQVKDSDQNREPAVETTTVQKTTTAPNPVLPGKEPPSPSPSASVSPFYATCEAAKAAGALPLKRGEPGYLPDFDMDQDGTACEGV